MRSERVVASPGGDGIGRGSHVVWKTILPHEKATPRYNGPEWVVAVQVMDGFGGFNGALTGRSFF